MILYGWIKGWIGGKERERERERERSLVSCKVEYVSQNYKIGRYIKPFPFTIDICKLYRNTHTHTYIY